MNCQPLEAKRWRLALNPRRLAVNCRPQWASPSQNEKKISWLTALFLVHKAYL